MHTEAEFLAEVEALRSALKDVLDCAGCPTCTNNYKALLQRPIRPAPQSTQGH